MINVALAVVFAGGVIGFVAGATNTPAAGVIASAVSGFAVGAFALASSSDLAMRIDMAMVAALFVAFQVCLLDAYLVTNVARRHGGLAWLLNPKEPRPSQMLADRRRGA